jgi:2-polyprenyl-3-methyl-5-hydroxy-6-metoxy-1,4-benzoquinol methylase
MNCPYCKKEGSTPSYLPSTRFNSKVFDYFTCNSCKVIYINPLPDEDDYRKMYPPSYQSGVNKIILKNQYKKLPGLRFSYGLQFDLIKTHFKKKPSILDYGCGNANFLLNALHSGFTCDGAEFSEEHVQLLKKEIPSSNFYTIKDFLENKSLSYDIIRLSNVLEHMDTPNEVITSLVEKLNTNGLLLVEGPIECNFNAAFLSRKFYFTLMHKLKKGYIADHTPTHITFTNRVNQLNFFEKHNLQTVCYKITESAWPYPESFISAKGFGGKTKAIIGKFSVFLSSFTGKWGNTFLYIGAKKS